MTDIFSRSEIVLLQRGLKYSPPATFDSNTVDDILVSCERAIKKSYSNDPVLFGHDCFRSVDKIQKSVVSKSSQIDNNVIRKIKQTLKEKDFIITKADKSNCVVVMDRSSYVKKTREFLKGPDFKVVNRNPTTSFNNKLKSTIKSCTHTFPSNTMLSKTLITSNPQTPRLYSLPKIHKTDTPVRPIVAFVNSPAHKLSKWLNQFMIRNLNFTPRFTVKNSLDLISKIKNITPPIGSRLVSFDVKNLFPSIPTQECLKVAKTLLTLSDLSDESVDEIFSLLSLTLSQNFFQFDSTFWCQTSGLSMGNPLSPLCADFFMDHLEQEYISKLPSFQNSVVFWFRYVDDVICLFNGSDSLLKSFLVDINSIHDNIVFTMEDSSNNSLPYLDLRISVLDNSFDFDIYRKPTNTDTLIPFDSCHPTSHKMASFHSLFHRLLNVPLSVDNYTKELNLIKQLAVNNGYPLNLIKKVYDRKLRKFNVSQLTSLTEIDDPPSFTHTFPFYGPHCYRFSKLFKKFNLNICFKVNRNLSNYFVNVKDPVPIFDKSGVYKLSCVCGSFYVGKTIRKFSIRIKEHLNLLKQDNRLLDDTSAKSAFAEHVLSCNHSLTDDFKSVLFSSFDPYTIDIYEKLHILKSIKTSEPLCLNGQIEFQGLYVCPTFYNK